MSASSKDTAQAAADADMEGLCKKVFALEATQEAMQWEKQQLEEEFGQKRAKFKDMYVVKEAELLKSQMELQSTCDHVLILESQLIEARAELEDIKAVAAVTESTKQETMDEIRRQWQEEIASLQAAMKETLRDYEMQFRNKLEADRGRHECEMEELRRRLAENGLEGNLEVDMRKAQEDAEKLRSVVMPMEQEISNLKGRLATAQEHVQQLEEVAGSAAEDAECEDEVENKVKELNKYLDTEKACRTDLEMFVAVLNTQKAVLQEDAERLRRELHEVCRLLEHEKQKHGQLQQTWRRANDQFLENQRLVVQDLNRLRSVLTASQLRQLEQMWRREQVEEQVGGKKEMDHTPLPPTSTAAKTVLSISVDDVRLTESAQACLPPGADSVADGLRRTQSSNSLGSRVIPTPIVPPSLSSHTLKACSDPHLDDAEFGPMVTASEGSTERFDLQLDSRPLAIPFTDNYNDSDVVTVTSDSDIGNGDAHTMGTSGPDGPSGAADTLGVGFVLTRDQEKAIKSQTPEQEETASLVSTATQEPGEANGCLPEGYRLVSESEWNKLQQEVLKAGSCLVLPCDMCSNYEQQLQGVQAQEAETRDQLKRLQIMLRQVNEQLEVEAREREQVDEKARLLGEECGCKLSQLQEKNQEAQAFLVELQRRFGETSHRMAEQLVMLSRAAEQSADEVRKLHFELEAAQGKRDLQLALLHEEKPIPNNVQELHQLVEYYRGLLAELRAGAEQREERLRAESLFLREQLQAEQGTREEMELALQGEIDTQRENVASLSSLQPEVEKYRKESEKLSQEVQERERNFEQFREAERKLEEHIQEEKSQRMRAEQAVLDERGKAQRLQAELDTSEQVQRDFVKLSQSLQVQLERIRQMESLEEVQAVLDSTNLSDVSRLPET
uniref:rab GTPase-binding effector protein 1 isoform X2 n=1 Tax=Myxine glutinosa TaxID=7769 RepID=UPI00358FCC55